MGIRADLLEVEVSENFVTKIRVILWKFLFILKMWKKLNLNSRGFLAHCLCGSLHHYDRSITVFLFSIWVVQYRSNQLSSWCLQRTDKWESGAQQSIHRHLLIDTWWWRSKLSGEYKTNKKRTPINQKWAENRIEYNKVARVERISCRSSKLLSFYRTRKKLRSERLHIPREAPSIQPQEERIKKPIPVLQIIMRRSVAPSPQIRFWCVPKTKILFWWLEHRNIDMWRPPRHSTNH